MSKKAGRPQAVDAKEREALMDVARGNVERNADWNEESSPDEIYDSVYTLAFDALHDHGCDRDVCSDLAKEIAMSYAQP
jgi:hypothetical protein